MKTKSFVRTVATLAAATLSTACLAGGRSGYGPMFHGGGFHGPRIAAGSGAHSWGGAHSWRGVPAAIGFRGRLGGIYGPRFGHTNTAVFGHTNTAAPNGWRRPFFGRFDEFHRFTRVGRGFERDRRFPSYAFAPRGRFGYGSVLPGYVGAGGYGSGYGGDDIGSAPGPATGSGQGYAETPLAASYSEAPLGPGPYFGPDDESSYAGGGLGGGPQVIVVHADGRPRRSEACSCARRYATTPVVYRFGVGSYY